MLAYGVSTDATNEYIKIGESMAIESVKTVTFTKDKIKILMGLMKGKIVNFHLKKREER